MPLHPGDRAPDFTLPSTNGEQLTLSSFRGQPVVLVFLRWLG
jgi:peroxiredoxin Q/BCP